MPYPPQLASVLVEALQLDGSGLLLDVGCGPGSLALLLAPYFSDVVGVDADLDMLTEAARLADEKQVHNVTWRNLRGEDLPADLPQPDVVTFAQSFHWMDRPKVAAVVRGMLAPDGALVHVGATTHKGIDSDDALPHPRPPWAAVTALAQRYLGSQRRAGQSVFASWAGVSGEDEIYRDAGFGGPQAFDVPGPLVERTIEEVAASVYSLSSSAPHLFGDRFVAFDRELRQMLVTESDNGWFSERMRSVTVKIWR